MVDFRPHRVGWDPPSRASWTKRLDLPIFLAPMRECFAWNWEISRRWWRWQPWSRWHRWWWWWERVVCVRHGDPTEMTCGQGDTTALQSTGDHCSALRCIAVRWGALQCNSLQCHTLQCSEMFSIWLECSALYWLHFDESVSPMGRKAFITGWSAYVQRKTLLKHLVGIGWPAQWWC